MKKWLMMAGMLAATCAFGGVYDDCVYLFEGGLDANGNGLFSTGELRDELHANPSHANNGAVVSGYSDYFDYHRFQFVPPSDGTYIVIK